MSNEPLTFIVLGAPQPSVDVDDLEPVQSTLTGKMLRHVEIIIVLNGDELNEKLNNELNAARGLKPAEIRDTDGGRWTVRSRRYSHTPGIDRYVHRVELIEKDQVVLDRLEFQDLSIAPDRWFANADREPAVLSAMFDLESDEHTKLEQVFSAVRNGELQYFPVRQIGIREEAVSMRFGRCYWEALDNGRVRHVVHLVAEDGDDQPGLLFNEPERTRLIEASIANSRKIEALIQELKAAGFLDDAAVDRIAEFGRQVPHEAQREFDRASNVEDFFRE
jgi:hypothetical protein